MNDSIITKEQFFKDYKFELKILETGYTVACGEQMKDAAWEMIKQGIDLAMIYTIGSDSFNFSTETADYIFTKHDAVYTDQDCEGGENNG